MTTTATIPPPIPALLHLQPTLPLTQPITHPLIPPILDPTDPTINPPPSNPTGEQEKDTFYDTEQDEELELPSGSQISGNKDLREGPPEDEGTSKKSRVDDPANPTLNE
jgi:hypothetical protein